MIVHGRDESKAQAVADSIESEGGTARVVTGDLATDAGAAQVARKVREVGPVDILVNNAGVYETSSWDTETTDHWIRATESNVLSAVRMIQALLPDMKRRGWGRIIQMGSGTGHQPLAGYPQYGATKAAMLNMTVSLSRHLRGTGVTSNILTAGLIRVDSLENMFRATRDDFGWGETWEEIEQGALRDFVPNDVGRIGTPEDVACIVAMLASPLSRYVSGANWQVDGGSTMGI
ncbi:NAD(P)-dependent dehydrogenase (short-subunit alcohol dehydrogenase family) [Kutzneria viridogrisea]|uniref:Short-chain dehydrogenase/reductase SDR n=2 Tax=Kutzneria TaxID=43356 RepID=W5WEI6_9PSEU|nr:hypothetical protein KALB_5654 [Kutzneria albida DSM 43870]MBA8923428.1 NAD(P)-dependent dehydrogenase (short-subunit alcohol dehydrogenase family) [Kutzneria viridogrisea]